MLHLFLWRDLKPDVRPDTDAIQVVNFGDRPSQTIAMCALQKAARLGEENYTDACNMITKNSYMDDLIDSVPSLEDARRLSSEVDLVLSKAGFKVKEWITSGDKQEASEEGEDIDASSIEEKVLGVKWHVTEDEISCQTNIYDAHVSESEKLVLTKRKVLGFVNGIYDPLGLIAPVTIKAKMMMRTLWTEEKSLNWDDPMPNHIVKEWKALFEELYALEEVRFSRAVKPKNDVGQPELILFSDGSKESYGTVAYARWLTKNNTYKACLLASMNRVAPAKTMDIVRLELCGAVLSKRLRIFIVEEMRYTFKAIYHLIDSQIVKAMITKNSYGFNTFVANRIGEIQEKTEPEEWLWIPGKVNVSDWLTRPKKPHNILCDSIWQQGLPFLEERREDWPVSKDWELDDIPGMIKGYTTTTDVKVKESLQQRINISAFSKLQFLLNVTAIVLGIYRKFNTRKDDEMRANVVGGKMDLEKAELFWIRDAQISLKERMEKGEFLKFAPRYQNEVIVIGGRCIRWNQATWNKQEFILLPREHQLSYLIALDGHKRAGHLGVSSTIAMIRSKYWILKIDKLVGSIINKCIICKKQRANFAQQVMSDLPPERLIPSPPFTNVGVDYFGPFLLKGEVQKRTLGKGYGVVFTCVTSRAVYVDVVQNYSTDGFMQVIRRFAAIRGWPKWFYSDNGSNLVGASKELKEIISRFKEEELIRYANQHGTEWKFTPAEAPWMNGVTESMVKSVKRSISNAIGSQVMEFSVMLTVLFEVSQLVNSRPIGKHPRNPEEGCYLCPNDLLLGRSSARIPQGPFKEHVSVAKRYEFIQSITETFWRKWVRDCFPSLIARKKWHVEKQNVLVDDMVLIKDNNAKRGVWKVGIVKDVKISGDGRVRCATVAYKTIPEHEPVSRYAGSPYTEVERPVHNLIVLDSPNENIDNTIRNNDVNGEQ